jgi:hypothetical protein
LVIFVTAGAFAALSGWASIATAAGTVHPATSTVWHCARSAALADNLTGSGRSFCKL